MKIAIDARLIGETGVGRYIRNLIRELAVLDRRNQYVVFVGGDAFDRFSPPNPRWKKVRADVRWHTFAEQWTMPLLYRKERPDLVHIPYHNPPIFYQGKTVLTIHDLTILHTATGKATTLPAPFYVVRRAGYWFGLAVGLRKASHIIAVSETTKREIRDHFNIPPGNISVTYEGVDPSLLSAARSTGSDGSLVRGPFLLYVGNAYPHKHLDLLVSAFSLLVRDPAYAGMTLVLVGEDDYFYRRLKQQVSAGPICDRVVFLGSVSDRDLVSLYRSASAFVFPSRMEGFGLPAIEARMFGCPVIVSDIAVFHEILGEFATYFDPSDSHALCQAIQRVIRLGKRDDTKEVAEDLAKRYSWRVMASETLSVYESCTRV